MPALVWIISIAIILLLVGFDLVFHTRRAHVQSTKECVSWLAFYVICAVLFGVGLGLLANWDMAAEYFAGYLTEEALSFDNIFMFLLIIGRMAVPREQQPKVLLLGILIALISRSVLIFAGAAIISAFSWVFFIFGAYLLYTAVKTLIETKQHHSKRDDSTEKADRTDSSILRLLKKVLPTTDSYDGGKFISKQNNKHFVTPLLLTVLSIGLIDVLFALDSIPAIFGLTTNAYIVLMCNAFALLGLRQIYFILDQMLGRLKYLSYGLAAILGFIGVKLVLEALHLNVLPFINGGQPVAWAPEISIPVSLGFILVILLIVVLASVLSSRKH